MQRLFFLAALLPLAALAAVPAAEAQRVQRIAAIVNDDVVSVYDLEARMKMVIVSSGLQATRETRERLRPQVLRSLIDERLRLQEAKRRNIRVTKRNMRAAIRSIEKRNNVPRGQFSKFLADRDIPEYTVLGQIRAQIAWRKLVNRRLRPRVTVSDDEVEEVLQRMKARQGETEYRIAEIFLTMDSPDRAADVRRAAERLVAQIRAGAKFDVLARQFSQSATASVGGDLGWLQAPDLGDDLAAVVPRLKPGRVSDPVRGLTGFRIVKLIDKRRILAGTPGDTRLTLRQIFLPLPRRAGTEAVENQLRLARTLRRTVSGCADMARAAAEANSPASSDLGEVTLGVLSPEIRDAVKDLEIGRPSAPVRTATGVLVMMVCKRVKPPATMPTREQIETRLRAGRLGLMARRYMRDLRYAAVVDLRI